MIKKKQFIIHDRRNVDRLIPPWDVDEPSDEWLAHPLDAPMQRE